MRLAQFAIPDAVPESTETPSATVPTTTPKLQRKFQRRQPPMALNTCSTARQATGSKTVRIGRPFLRNRRSISEETSEPCDGRRTSPGRPADCRHRSGAANGSRQTAATDGCRPSLLVPTECGTGKPRRLRPCRTARNWPSGCSIEVTRQTAVRLGVNKPKRSTFPNLSSAPVNLASGSSCLTLSPPHAEPARWNSQIALAGGQQEINGNEAGFIKQMLFNGDRQRKATCNKCKLLASPSRTTDSRSEPLNDAYQMYPIWYGKH